jgi:hypothetical protein
MAGGFCWLAMNITNRNRAQRRLLSK